MNKIITIFIIIAVLGLGLYVWKGPESARKLVDNRSDEIVKMCYLYSNKTKSGLSDKSFVRINIIGDNVAGEFGFLPAEKDSKTGTFLGTAGPVNQSKMSRTITAWADTIGEGVKNKEEIVIDFGDGSAAIAFGTMVKKEDGSYAYKDKTKLTYGPSMSQIDCTELDSINLAK